MARAKFAKKQILVVDDVDFIRRSVAGILSANGLDVVELAGSVAEALRIINNEPFLPDCLITDLKMPRIHGLQFLRAIRTNKTSLPRGVPVVMLTGYAERPLLGVALQLDVDAFLAKPVAAEATSRDYSNRGRVTNGSLCLSRTRFPWTQNWLNRSVQGGPEHDR